MGAIFTKFVVPILAALGLIGGGAVVVYEVSKESVQQPVVVVEQADVEKPGAEGEYAEVLQDQQGASTLGTGDTSYGNASITSDVGYRYISSDGIPNHETGEFPGKGNPNTISEQSHNYRVTINPVYKSSITKVQLAGVALNGIPLEPGTAEFYNKDRSSGWVEEAFLNGVGGLGIDWSNAHVQPDGTYHYHAVPEGLLEQALENQSGDLIQLAWASDGHGMYYSQDNVYSVSWRIESGTRSGGPGGSHTGKYTQDWEYVEGLGDLDECNGIEIDGQYLYILTKDFPFIGRCVHGVPDESFAKGPGTGSGQIREQETGIPTGPTGTNGPIGGGVPPQEAIDACKGKSQGSPCSIPAGPTGTCMIPRGQTVVACVPG